MIDLRLTTAEASIIEAALRDRIAILQAASSESVRRGLRHQASLQMRVCGVVQTLQARIQSSMERA